MFTIYTSEDFESLNSHFESQNFISGEALFLPENYQHPRGEREKIKDYFYQHKDSGVIYTLSEVSLNFLGQMIHKKQISFSDCQIIILPENETFYYNEKGFVQKWRYGFFEPDIDN